MVSHNNALPNVHLRKHWERIGVRTHLNQAGAKKSRRDAREKKRIAAGTRPLGLLRPAVRGQTFKYNTKVRLGRGFTLEELKAAGVQRKQARSIGIAVDFRRRNRCEESLKLNGDRLKLYMSKLVIFPKDKRHPKKNDSKAEDLKDVKQVSLKEAFPIKATYDEVEARAITAEEKAFNPYTESRKAWSKAKHAGKALKREQEKAAAEAEAKK